MSGVDVWGGYALVRGGLGCDTTDVSDAGSGRANKGRLRSGGTGGEVSGWGCGRKGRGGGGSGFILADKVLTRRSLLEQRPQPQATC